MLHGGFAYIDKSDNLSGVSNETSCGIDAVLLRVGDGTSFVYSGNHYNPDVYYRMSYAWILSVLLLNMKKTAVL